MRIEVAEMSMWLCSLCGHIWRMRDDERPPVHCAKCGQRGWGTERTVDSELEGA